MDDLRALELRQRRQHERADVDPRFGRPQCELVTGQAASEIGTSAAKPAWSEILIVGERLTLR